MTEQEKTNAEVQLKLSVQDAKFELLMHELKEQREDIRATNAKIDAKFDALIKQIHDNFIQTLIGVGAIMAAIGGLLFTALK